MKKLLIIGLLMLILVIGAVWYYNSHKTIECWWGVMYPTLSYVAIEDDDGQSKTADKGTQISSLEPNYVGYSTEKTQEEPIKFKLAIIEFFNKYFK